MTNQLSSSSQPTFGFLCPQTNTFYAFDTYEEYQMVLAWINQNGEG
jgi:hypothetical protein